MCFKKKERFRYLVLLERFSCFPIRVSQWEWEQQVEPACCSILQCRCPPPPLLLMPAYSLVRCPHPLLKQGSRSCKHESLTCQVGTYCWDHGVSQLQAVFVSWNRQKRCPKRHNYNHIVSRIWGRLTLSAIGSVFPLVELIYCLECVDFLILWTAAGGWCHWCIRRARNWMVEMSWRCMDEKWVVFL